MRHRVAIRSRNPARRIPAALVLAGALLLLASVPPATAYGGDGWWSDLDRGEVVSLGDLRARPRQFTGRTLTFFAIVRGPDKVFLLQNSTFTRSRYANLSVWPDGTPLWEQAAYERQEFPTVYIARSHPRRDALLRLPRFTRVEITGQIGAIVSGRPCIEVASWREASHRLGRDVVDAVVRGDIYANAGDVALARAKYQEAMAVDLPEVYRLRIRQRAAQALRKLGALDEADRVEAGAPILTRGARRGPGNVPPEPADPFAAAAAPGAPPAAAPNVGAPPPADFAGDPGVPPAGAATPPGAAPPPQAGSAHDPIERAHGDPFAVPTGALPGAPPAPRAAPVPHRPMPHQPAPAGTVGRSGDPFLDHGIGDAPPPDTRATPALPAKETPRATPGRRTATPPARRGAPPKRRPRLVGVR